MASRHARFASISEYSPLHITATGNNVPVGNCVSTTSSTIIVAGSDISVTPASMNNIAVGRRLNVANGTGTAEDVVVKTVGASSFTADFQYGHSGAYTIISNSGTFLGPLIVANPGSNVTLTLYNGHPQNGHGSTTISVFPVASPGSLPFACALDSGLFYTLAVGSGGSAPDLTLQYIDMID